MLVAALAGVLLRTVVALARPVAELVVLVFVRVTVLAAKLLALVVDAAEVAVTLAVVLVTALPALVAVVAAVAVVPAVPTPAALAA